MSRRPDPRGLVCLALAVLLLLGGRLRGEDLRPVSVLAIGDLQFGLNCAVFNSNIGNHRPFPRAAPPGPAPGDLRNPGGPEPRFRNPGEVIRGCLESQKERAAQLFSWARERWKAGELDYIVLLGDQTENHAGNVSAGLGPDQRAVYRELRGRFPEMWRAIVLEVQGNHDYDSTACLLGDVYWDRYDEPGDGDDLKNEGRYWSVVPEGRGVWLVGVDSPTMASQFALGCYRDRGRVNGRCAHKRDGKQVVYEPDARGGARCWEAGCAHGADRDFCVDPVRENERKRRWLEEQVDAFLADDAATTLLMFSHMVPYHDPSMARMDASAVFSSFNDMRRCRRSGKWCIVDADCPGSPCSVAVPGHDHRRWIAGLLRRIVAAGKEFRWIHGHNHTNKGDNAWGITPAGRSRWVDSGLGAAEPLVAGGGLTLVAGGGGVKVGRFWSHTNPSVTAHQRMAGRIWTVGADTGRHRGISVDFVDISGRPEMQPDIGLSKAAVRLMARRGRKASDTFYVFDAGRPGSILAVSFAKDGADCGWLELAFDPPGRAAGGPAPEKVDGRLTGGIHVTDGSPPIHWIEAGPLQRNALVIEARADATGLAPGTHQCDVLVVDARGNAATSVERLPVELTVE